MKLIHIALSAAALAAVSLGAASCAGLSGAKSAKAGASGSTKIVADMKIGWNLGNTLDAWEAGLDNGLGSETSWGQPRTTPEMFKGLANSGIKTVRIPVTWHNHLVDSNYTIDTAWMARVKEVVDEALGAGLYVIINVHHDTAETADVQYGQGYYPAEVAKDESLKFLTRVWEQIAQTFNKGYDEHLIFEVMNEPRLRGHEREWWYDPNNPDCPAAQAIVIEYEEACLRVIRKSGGNNARRYVMVPGYVAQPWAAMADSFHLPADSAKNKLIISVHAYDPWTFAGENPGETKFTQEARDGIAGTFSALNEKFVSKGVGVVIGECGATNKNNLPEREAWFRFYFENAKKNGITAIMWDNGSWEVDNNTFEEHFGYYNRTEQTWYWPTLLKAALDGVTAGESQ